MSEVTETKVIETWGGALHGFEATVECVEGDGEQRFQVRRDRPFVAGEIVRVYPPAVPHMLIVPRDR